MITEAVQLRASDIHVEPFEDRVRIRYRIDGVLHERDRLPQRQLGADHFTYQDSVAYRYRRKRSDRRTGGSRSTLVIKSWIFESVSFPPIMGQSAVLRLVG